MTGETGSEIRASGQFEGAPAYIEPRPLDVDSLKLALCDIIMDILSENDWTYASAESVTGVARQDFARIKGKRISLFKIERLLYIIHRTGRSFSIEILINNTITHAA